MHASVAFAAILALAVPAAAQTTTQPGPGAAGQAKPARGPEQSSTPSAAPPPTPQQTTGSREQDPGVKQMNEAERRKVEEHGK